MGLLQLRMSKEFNPVYVLSHLQGTFIAQLQGKPKGLAEGGVR